MKYLFTFLLLKSLLFGAFETDVTNFTITCAGELKATSLANIQTTFKTWNMFHIVYNEGDLYHIGGIKYIDNSVREV